VPNTILCGTGDAAAQRSDAAARFEGESVVESSGLAPGFGTGELYLEKKAWTRPELEKLGDDLISVHSGGGPSSDGPAIPSGAS